MDKGDNIKPMTNIGKVVVLTVSAFIMELRFDCAPASLPELQRWILDYGTLLDLRLSGPYLKSVENQRT